jgi:hypothetical protein
MSLMKPKSNASVPPPLPGWILLATLSVLTACAKESTDATSSLRIYTPRTLTLQPGAQVQTPGGIYTPQVLELWHSDAAFRDLERRLLDAGYQINELRKNLEK